MKANQIVKVARRFDFLSPPVLFGGMYLYLFGLGVIDAAFDEGLYADRLRYLFYDFHGVSASALAYVWLGYTLFVLGYRLPVGRVIARIFPTGALSFSPWRASIITTALFGAAFLVVIWISQRFGYSRIPGFAVSEEIDPNLSYLYIVGDLVLMAYSLSVWRFMLSRRPGGPPMSKGARLFLWGVMFPLLAVLLVWTASRSKLAYMLFTTLLAYHYGYRRLRPRSIFIVVFIYVVLIMPMIAFVRASAEQKSTLESVSSILAWNRDVVMQRTSALEGFTVTFENLDTAPDPDPFWMVFASGFVPRLIWPNKPISTWSERFSTWASGRPNTVLTPSLPGELLLHFGIIGGLLAMLALGILWRTAFGIFIGFEEQPFAVGFIYIFLLPLSLQAIEGGFVKEYGGLLRFLLVGVVVMCIVSTPRSKSVRVVKTHERLTAHT